MVRPARASEYTAAGELTVEAYVGGGFFSPASSYVPILRDAADRAEKAELLVAELGGTLVGVVAYCPPGSPYRNFAPGPAEAEFRMLAVAERARGRGVGESLVRACVARARETGMTALRLATQQDMRAAQRMYERMGFVRTPDLDWSVRPGHEKMWTYALTL